MFVLKEDGALVAMKPAQFALEDHFQRLLEDHPELLAGDLIDPEEPRRWLLVNREMAIPGEADGGGWWAADHLFLDQDGIPTIVEVKRQTDTRLRREVIAQMLDYAANGAAFWTVDSIRTAFETRCQKYGRDPEEEIKSRLGQIVEAVKFWTQVKTNLEAQRLRLLFVADVIPRELRRIVEFLNRQMNPAEVLALELRQFTGENGLRTVVPNLFGQTEDTRGAKSAASPGKMWTEDQIFETFSAKFDTGLVEVAREISAWMKRRSTNVVLGRGKVDGSLSAVVVSGDEKSYPLMLSTVGKVYVNFGYCKRKPFDSVELRREWLRRLNEAVGLNLSVDSVDKFPGLNLTLLQPPDKLAAFLGVMGWVVEQLQASTVVD